MKKVLLAASFVLSSSAAFAGSVVTAGGMDYSNVTITGDAAKTIFNKMTDVTAESTGPRTAGIVVKKTRDITCTRGLEVAALYTCRFSVDSKGQVRGDFAK